MSCEHCACDSVLKSSKKSENKHNRKIKKCCKILEKFETNISATEDPTNTLFVGNGGLVCGFDYEQLYCLFCEYGSMQDIILIPDRPYSFVVFEDVKSASCALNNVNSKIKSPLYLVYTDKVPKVKSSLVGYALPPGLLVVEDFVSLEEEEELLELMSGCDQMLKSRTVQHFGFEFDYSTNNMYGSRPLLKKIPSSCDKILLRIVQRDLIKDLPDQLTVNHYLVGQGIPPHVDTHSAFEDGIVSLSLQSQVVMEFRHPSGAHVPVYLPRRSLLVMTGESRYVWNHGITCRKNDIVPVRTKTGTTQLALKAREARTSFTFRKVRSGNCVCGFNEFCDQKGNTSSSVLKKSEEKCGSLSLEDSTAKELEKLHVHKVYNDIAGHFSDTRYKPWPKIEAFLNTFKIGSIIYDIGCGNGKYLGRHTNSYQVGCDMSMNLLKICRERKLEVFESDILALPLRHGTADGVLCIAVIHHLSTLERRRRALEEIYSLLSVGGVALIYVWAIEQNSPSGPSNYIKPTRSKFHSENTSQEEKIHGSDVLEVNVLDSVSLPVHVNRTQFVEQDMLVPWKSVKNSNNEPKVFHRYYHLFQENELSNLTRSISSLEILDSYYDKGNWCVKVKKK